MTETSQNAPKIDPKPKKPQDALERDPQYRLTRGLDHLAPLDNTSKRWQKNDQSRASR